MELLRVKISSDGKMMGDGRGVISLTQDSNFNLYESSRMLESGKITPITAKEEKKDIGSTGSFSPPSHQYLYLDLDILRVAFQPMGLASPKRKCSLMKHQVCLTARMMMEGMKALKR